MNDTVNKNEAKLGFLYPSIDFDVQENSVAIKGILVAKFTSKKESESLSFFIADKPCKLKKAEALFSIKKGLVQLLKVEFSFPLDFVYQLPIHNAIKASLFDGIEFKQIPIRFSIFMPKYLAKTSGEFVDKDSCLTAFLRQSAGKSLFFTVRNINETDSMKAKMKLRLAWLLSKVMFWYKPVLLFEKNGQHYEESARVVFERLIDKGRRDVRFVLRGDMIESLGIEEKYKKQMLKLHSFAHYLSFFRSRSFLGTEALAHALELRCQSLLVQRKIKNRKNSYIFLQHGVMYMVSLDSPERSSFRKKNMKGNSFVVISSEKEAQHFTDYADFSRDDLILSGLPKFDKSYMHETADKILIMPTWRIWEFNAMRKDPESTNYVKMIARIKDAIPESLKSKVIVASHPLFNESTFGGAIGDKDVSYDELLRDVSLLITDYSSISYDAFFRGAKVIFYWEEKDECMEKYGEGTHLMLNEENAFGTVCYSAADLAKVIEAIYEEKRSEEHESKYREIVQYNDRRNTERLIEFAEKRGVI